MGQIVSTYDILPESTDIDLKKIVADLPNIVPKGVKLIEEDTKIAPVAFGLMKIVAAFVIDDSIETIGGDLENALTSIPGIQNVECVSSTNY